MPHSPQPRSATLEARRRAKRSVRAPLELSQHAAQSTHPHLTQAWGRHDLNLRQPQAPPQPNVDTTQRASAERATGPQPSPFKAYLNLMQADLFRVAGRLGAWAFVKTFFRDAGFKYCALMRTCTFLYRSKALRYTLYPAARFVMKQFGYRYNVAIPPRTDIGPGLFIGHVGGIVVNGRTKIGKNCNLSQGVTIGQTNRGAKQGCPTIGDNVYIGPNAVIVGRIRVGNNVAIGANCVVTKDVPDNAVVVGIPGRVISDEGSEGYINRTEYEAQLYPGGVSSGL